MFFLLLNVIFRVYASANHDCDFKIGLVIACGFPTALLHWKFAFVYIFMELSQTAGTLHFKKCYQLNVTRPSENISVTEVSVSAKG